MERAREGMGTEHGGKEAEGRGRNGN